MSETDLALLILAGPFAAALLLGCVPPLRRAGRLAALVSLGGIGVALYAAVRLVTGLWLAGVGFRVAGGAVLRQATLTLPWLAQTGPQPLATAGVYVDPLAAAMAALVTLVAGLVQLYSLGYLGDETPPALGRYYLYQSLFAFSMLGLVFAPNFLQLFVFWELVGLCSYLLIGFYYQRPAAARAAVKAFWVTKLGDVGFLLGIVLLWGATGTFEFTTLFRSVAAGALPAHLTLYMTLIYLGAVGKSAQFPLHVWLPDAMEGPTPVSALIHAATMVTAGVFLVARAYPLFLGAPGVLLLIAYVGAFTALLAATLALGESDIKRVLAYSTVSQLGYMMAALGAGALTAGVLHLLLHGFFKALLFLAAGAVIHAVHTNDMGAMGRLGRAMPRTAVVFVVGTLALAGVPPFSGFVSKEAILGGVWEAGLHGPFVLLSVTVFLTAFYMFRAVFLTFFGARGSVGGHPHDPPGVMMGPLWILALLSILGAVLGGNALGQSFPEYLGLEGGATLPHGPHWLTAFSVGLALAGVLLAWLVYQRQVVAVEELTRGLGPLPAWAARGYGLDALYVAVYRGIVLVLARLVGWIDRYVVDGVVNVASALTLRAGTDLRRLQTGRAQDYLYGVTAGLLLVLVLWRLWA
jgi:NADH-quinone oxidoreductase subunit L